MSAPPTCSCGGHWQDGGGYIHAETCSSRRRAAFRERLLAWEGQVPAPRHRAPSNLPGGKWHSTPNTLRRSPALRFTLSPEAVAALAFLAPDTGTRSRAVSDALVAAAQGMGWEPPAA